MADSAGVDEWLDASVSLHSALFSQEGCPRTEEIRLSLMTASQPYSALNIGALRGRADAERQHTEMVDAVEARDSERLTALFAAHLLGARERLLNSAPNLTD